MKAATVTQASWHTGNCPCNGCSERSDRFIAYAEEHGTEPEECRDCLALTDALSDDGLCPECVAAGEPS